MSHPPARQQSMAAALAMRLAGACLYLCFSLPLAAPGYGQGAAADRALPDGVQRIEIAAQPLARFWPASLNGQPNRFLGFRGGLVLSSGHASFGGWSGITVDADGKRFLAVSDEGTWLSGELAYRGKAPIGIVNASIGPIRALRGRTLDKKRDLDAEAIHPMSGTLAAGQVLVGFERNHRIGVFPVTDGMLDTPTRYLKLPPEARRMRSNKGLEAVAVLKGGPSKGAVVAFAERFPGEIAHHTGWIWLKDQPHRLSLVDRGDFEITDAASLDDGTLILLERRFRWTEGVKMRLRRIPPDALKPAAILDGEVLIEADLTSEIDNMEGLAIHREPTGETVLTLISDNNFNPLLQRNLLLQFTLADPGRPAAAR